MGTRWNGSRTLVFVPEKGGEEVKNRIKERRQERSLSQEELANLCNVSRQTINCIENDKYDPTLSLAFRISAVLGVCVDKLFLFERGEGGDHEKTR